MKRLSLVNLYKAEIKKSMLAQIKGGDVNCTCAVNHPVVTIRQSGGPEGEYCACNSTNISSSSVHNKPD